MKEMGTVMQGYNSGQMQSQNEQNSMAKNTNAPEQVISLVNKITARFEGIYQYTGNVNQRKTNLYKQELTKALYQVRHKIDETKINQAINFFALHGGSFAPSIPEFMKVVLGQHEEQIKAPELKWFDASKALPQHTPEQLQKIGQHGVSLAREALKKKPLNK